MCQSELIYQELSTNHGSSTLRVSGTELHPMALNSQTTMKDAAKCDAIMY